MKTEPTESLSIKRANIVDKYLPAGDEQRYYERLKMHEELIDLINSHSPKIKQLEWEEYRDCLVSTTPFYNVSIKEVCGIYELATAYSAFIKSYNSLEEAKAAAQADFEKRVKECLE
mgnify:CR=1 FL=1